MEVGMVAAAKVEETGVERVAVATAAAMAAEREAVATVAVTAAVVLAASTVAVMVAATAVVAMAMFRGAFVSSGARVRAPKKGCWPARR